MDFRIDMLSEEALEQHIDQCKVGYVTCQVNLLKTPSLIARCEEELKKDMPEEKRKMYETQIESHKKQMDTDKEQMVSLSEIYDRLINFQKECQQ
jgi:hypothetical protein